MEATAQGVPIICPVFQTGV